MLGALLLFHFIANLVWIYLNKNPLDFDPIGHTLISINSAEYIKTHLLTFNLREFMTISQAYPNFTHIVSLIPIFIFGNYWKVIQSTGTIFFLITITCTFFYVKEISGKPQVAFFSAFFYSFFISVVQYSRFHMLDIPLTAMIILTLYLWERLKKTSAYRYLYASAFSFAFAELTKWHAVVFLFIPSLFLLAWAIKHKKFYSVRFLTHLAICIMIIIILIIPWYFYNFESFIRLGAINYKGEADDPHNLLSLTNILFYPSLIINYQVQFFGFILLIISFYNIFRKKSSYLKISLLSSLFVYIFFTFFVINKNIRVLFPIMPFIAIYMAYGITRIKTLTAVFCIYCIFTFLILSFGIPFKPNKRIEMNIPVLGPTELVYLHTYPVNLLYSGEKIEYDAVINNIISYYPITQRPVRVLIGVHLPYFHSGQMVLEVYSENQNDISFANREIFNKKIQINDMSTIIGKDESLADSLSGFDIIVTAINDPIHPEQIYDAFYKPTHDIRMYLLNPSNRTFSFSSSYLLPNNDQLLLFTNKKLLK